MSDRPLTRRELDAYSEGPLNVALAVEKREDLRPVRVVGDVLSGTNIITNVCLCEWNPWAGEAAVEGPDGSSRCGCPNPAVVRVGADGQWHLCESCAALPRFKRFRSRAPLEGAGP